jgi:chromosome segregation ATPase
VTEESLRHEPAPGEAEEALRQELADANRRAEDALLEAAAARDQNEALEQRCVELAESLRERQAAFDELDVWRGELERRLASMSTELGAATARRREQEQELRRRAIAEAGELAARELAEAAADHSRREAGDPEWKPLHDKMKGSPSS